MNYFTTMIAWSNRRLNVLNIIVTQKMGLFRHRLFQQDQHPDFSRHQFQQGTQSKVRRRSFAPSRLHFSLVLSRRP